MQTWISAHLFYFNNPDLLLTACIKPLVEELRARHLIEKYFFVRYWQGGPHIRLRLRSWSEDDEPEIKEILAGRAQAFFLAHPSTGTIDHRQYEELTHYLSLIEYGEDRRIPLYDANSLHYIAYQPEYKSYGGIEVMPYVETHFMQSSDIALTLLAKNVKRNHISGQALSMTLLALVLAESQSEELKEPFDKYFLAWEQAPNEIRIRYYAQFSQQYQRQRQYLSQLTKTLLGIVSRGETHERLPISLQDWLRSLQHLYQALPLIDPTNSLSVEHQTTEFRSLMSVAWHCVHMHNNRLGVLNWEEAYIFFLLRQMLSETALNRT